MWDINISYLNVSFANAVPKTGSFRSDIQAPVSERLNEPYIFLECWTVKKAYYIFIAGTEEFLLLRSFLLWFPVKHCQKSPETFAENGNSW